MSKDIKDMSGKEYADWLFSMITGAVCPSASNLPQVNADKPQENKVDICLFCGCPVLDDKPHHDEIHGGVCHAGCCPICNEYGGE